eukprot:6191880-Pleurochrysis_carterae.AAC.3
MYRTSRSRAHELTKRTMLSSEATPCMPSAHIALAGSVPVRSPRVKSRACPLAQYQPQRKLP